MFSSAISAAMAMRMRPSSDRVASDAKHLVRSAPLRCAAAQSTVDNMASKVKTARPRGFCSDANRCFAARKSCLHHTRYNLFCKRSYLHDKTKFTLEAVPVWTSP